MALGMVAGARGDQADPVIDRLIGLHSAAYGLASRFLSGRDGAEDIVQHAYVEAFEHLRSSPPPSDERAWFLTVVANAARNHLRGEAARGRREAVVQGQRGSSQEIDAELVSMLNKAMNSLAEERRIPLALCYEQGLSHREAAAVLNMPKGTLTRHVSEGLEELRRTLAKAGYAALPAAIVGALVHTAPVAPIGLAAAVGKILAGTGLAKGMGVGAAVSTAAKGGVAMKIVAGVVAAGLLAGGVAVAPKLLGGRRLEAPPATKAVEAPVDVSPPAIVITPEQVKDLFGDKPAKLVFCVRYGSSRNVDGAPGQTVFYRHFLVDLAKPPFTPVKILDSSWKDGILDPETFISPDGTRLVFEDGGGVQACELKPGGGGRAKVADNGGVRSDPRWWVHPKTGDEYIIHCKFEGKNQWGGLICGFGPGKTLIQKLEKGTCKPQGAPAVLIDKYTFNSGRSPDGKYMCAGGPGWALAEFKPEAVEDALIKVIKTGPAGRCNESISQENPTRPERALLWMDPGHENIYWAPRLDTEPDWKDEWSSAPRKPGKETASVKAGNKVLIPGAAVNTTNQLQNSEWSTHPDFFTVMRKEAVDRPTGACEAYLWQFSKPDRNGPNGDGWVKLAVHGQSHADQGAYGKDFKGKIEGKMESVHLWVQQDGKK